MLKNINSPFEKKDLYARHNAVVNKTLTINSNFINYVKNAFANCNVNDDKTTIINDDIYITNEVDDEYDIKCGTLNIRVKKNDVFLVDNDVEYHVYFMQFESELGPTLSVFMGTLNDDNIKFMFNNETTKPVDLYVDLCNTTHAYTSTLAEFSAKGDAKFFNINKYGRKIDNVTKDKYGRKNGYDVKNQSKLFATIDKIFLKTGVTDGYFDVYFYAKPNDDIKNYVSFIEKDSILDKLKKLFVVLKSVNKAYCDDRNNIKNLNKNQLFDRYGKVLGLISDFKDNMSDTIEHVYENCMISDDTIEHKKLLGDSKILFKKNDNKIEFELNNYIFTVSDDSLNVKINNNSYELCIYYGRAPYNKTFLVYPQILNDDTVRLMFTDNVENPTNLYVELCNNSHKIKGKLAAVKVDGDAIVFNSNYDKKKVKVLSRNDDQFILFNAKLIQTIDNREYDISFYAKYVNSESGDFWHVNSNDYNDINYLLFNEQNSYLNQLEKLLLTIHKIKHDDKDDKDDLLYLIPLYNVANKKYLNRLVNRVESIKAETINVDGVVFKIKKESNTCTITFNNNSVTIHKLQMEMTIIINNKQYDLLCVPYSNRSGKDNVAVFIANFKISNVIQIYYNNSVTRLMYDDGTIAQTNLYPFKINFMVLNAINRGDVVSKQLFAIPNIFDDSLSNSIVAVNGVNVEVCTLTNKLGKSVAFTEKSFIGKLCSFLNHIQTSHEYNENNNSKRKYLKYKMSKVWYI